MIHVYKRLSQEFPLRVEGWLNVCTNADDIWSAHRPAGAPPPPAMWEPYFCVLLQDEQTFNNYRSEEMAIGDSLFVELPRVRLDGGSKAFRRCWGYEMKPPPTLPEDDEAEAEAAETQSLNNQPPIYSPLDTSYEKACGDRRGSAPTTPVLGGRAISTDVNNTPSSKISLQSLFSKRSLKSNPLKRTKSVTKLERKRATVDSVTPARLRSSRSHESLLCPGGLGNMVTTLELGGPGGDINVTPVHPSVTSQPCIFQVQNQGMTRYYQTRTEEENNAWVYSLRKATQPHQDLQRRKENSLKICVQEAKGVAPKKKYFCEISLDTKLYGKTTSKLKGEMCLWGEQFDFNSLPAVGSIKIDLYREGDRKKKKNVHIGSVTIPVTAVSSRNMVEKWYTVSTTEKYTSSGKEQAALRIKCRFLSVDILPLSCYDEFLDYVKSCYCILMEMLEGAVSVKAKEDIATCMVHIMHNESLVQYFLTEVVMMDVKRIDDTVLTFRGNSLATKSVEAYMKLVGEHYLRETLEKFIKKMITEPCDCEVDPSKVANNDVLNKNRKNLRDAVDDVWRRILESYTKFPGALRECFAILRKQMEASGKADMADHLISASIFLRFLCPAILYPSLFNLSPELPDSKVSRNLTLVAKTLQTLANCTQFQGKESFMEYLNGYLGDQAAAMKTFLRQISTPTHLKSRHQEFHEKIDLGKQLSLLHTLICESLNKICKSYQAELERLQKILNDISARNTQPNINGNMMQVRCPGTPSPQPAEGFQSLQRNIFRFNDPTVSAQDMGDFSPHLHHRAATLPRGNPKIGGQDDFMLPGALACTNGHMHAQEAPHSWRDNTDCQAPSHLHNSVPNKRVPLYNGGPPEASELRFIDESSEGGGGGGAPHRGSQTSISALSNVASSGYQSFAAYSQSSSPVDPTIQQDNNLTPPVISNQIRALAFNNPMYDLDGRTPNKHSPSSSLSSQSGDTPPHSSLDTPPCERRKPYLHSTGVPRTNPRCGGHNRSNHHIRETPLAECRHPRCRPPGRRNRVSDYPVPSVFDTDSESEPESSRSRRTTHRQEENSKTFEEYERELGELKEQMEELQMKLHSAEQQLTVQKGDDMSWRHQEQIQEIIHRLQNVEHAQKQELAENQQVIKAQKDQIHALGTANSQLLGMLGQLRDRASLEHRSSSC